MTTAMNTAMKYVVAWFALPGLVLLFVVIVSASAPTPNPTTCPGSTPPQSPPIAGVAGSPWRSATASSAGIDAGQREVAAEIVTAVRAFPPTADKPEAAVIALATARQESGLHNLTYGDRDSLGVFQQRPSQGWGTPAQIMDVAHATTSFLQRLVAVPGWETRTVTDVAATIQRPAAAYRDLYQQWVPLAQQLTVALWAQSVALLPTEAVAGCSDGPPILQPPSSAGSNGPSGSSGSMLLARAQSWVDEQVPYSQSNEHTNAFGTYRQDCSGYVSMAWGLDRSFTTYDLPSIAHPIAKDDLRGGDILLKAGHTLLFDQWADASHTSYWAYEEQHQGTVAIHHVVPYPYWPGQGDFSPYRKN